MSATIWYLYHSGFAVETSAHFLVFDYWRTSPRGGELKQGVINPSSLSGKDVVVFVSHRHGDHFNPEILEWQGKIGKLRTILSDDISPVPDVFMLGPHRRLEQPDFVVETLRSNDEGVAFLVEIDGMLIYHAGDLNWWHWEGEPEDYNRGMAESYRKEIHRLEGKSIDLAFVPADPRLGEQYRWGIDLLLETVDVKLVVPMHFGKDTKVVDKLISDPASAPYRDRILHITKRGQSFRI